MEGLQYYLFIIKLILIIREYIGLPDAPKHKAGGLSHGDVWINLIEIGMKRIKKKTEPHRTIDVKPHFRPK